MGKRVKHLTSIEPLSADVIERLLVSSRKLKSDWKRGIRDNCLAGKSLGMIFHKPSMRTRVSFEVAMTQMGGHALFLSGDIGKLGERETPRDVAQVVSRYVDGIVIRTFEQSLVETLAENADVPVINGLSDYVHPCQALADVFTLLEKKGPLKGRRIVFLGDGNNVARSLAHAAAKLGLFFCLSAPKAYCFEKGFLERFEPEARKRMSYEQDPEAAVRAADVVYTDVWASMGQEKETARRRKAFQRYQVNERIMKRAPADAIVMHCLPAHRGDEITDEVIDGPQSVVLDQAENRLHVQKAILKLLLAGER
jgi:ornithine carbamoyltransferase